MVMHTLSKKEVERWQLNQFINAFPQFPDGTINESEEPDFLIHCAGKTIGIELTDLYWKTPSNGLPKQAQETYQDHIVKTAQKLFSKRNSPNLHVSIHFMPSYEPKKRDVSRLASAIDNLISNNIPKLNESYSEEYDWENRSYFPEEINIINIWHIPHSDDHFFSSPWSSSVPKLNEDDISRALILKELKLIRYRQTINEVWLLMCFDGGKLSTFFTHEEEVVKQTYKSSFDRVFLFSHIRSRVYELRVQP